MWYLYIFLNYWIRQLRREDDGLAGVDCDPLNLAAFLNNWVGSQCVGSALSPLNPLLHLCSALQRRSTGYKWPNRTCSLDARGCVKNLWVRGGGNVFSETLAFPSTGIIPLCCQLSLPSSTSKSEISAWQFMAERRAGECGKYSSHSRGKCDEKDQNHAHTHIHLCTQYTLVKQYRIF